MKNLAWSCLMSCLLIGDLARSFLRNCLLIGDCACRALDSLVSKRPMNTR